MWQIVMVMLSGVTVGYFIRKKKLNWVSRTITVVIWVLLFALGVMVGNNEMILGHLNTIGLQAFLLAIGAVVGSVVLAKVVYHFFFRCNERKGK